MANFDLLQQTAVFDDSLSIRKAAVGHCSRFTAKKKKRTGSPSISYLLHPKIGKLHKKIPRTRIGRLSHSRLSKHLGDKKMALGVENTKLSADSHSQICHFVLDWSIRTNSHVADSLWFLPRVRNNSISVTIGNPKEPVYSVAHGILASFLQSLTTDGEDGPCHEKFRVHCWTIVL